MGRSTKDEFSEAEGIMERFIGRKGVFLPKIIIVDDDGNHIETTYRTKLPVLERFKKSKMLGYEVFRGDMPLTNPADIYDELETRFRFR